MATINRCGTLRYDWTHHGDGTAEATLWLVLGFLPVIPLKRQRLRVISDGLEPPRAVGVAGAALGAALGAGAGFRSRIQVLAPAPMKLGGILRTYLYGFVVTPLLAFGVPIAACFGAYGLLNALGIDMRKYGDIIVIALGITGVGWMAVVIAKILDRAAGRINS